MQDNDSISAQKINILRDVTRMREMMQRYREQENLKTPLADAWIDRLADLALKSATDDDIRFCYKYIQEAQCHLPGIYNAPESFK